MPIESETKNDQDSDYAERNANKRAKSPGRLLRLDGGRQPPLAQEIPDAHAEVERRSEHPHDKEREVPRSEEHTSELQSRLHLVCRLLLEKKKKNKTNTK